MSNKLPFRILSAVCATLLLLLSLTACSSSPLTPSAQAKKEVGTVGDHTVLYEELYTAAKGCYRDGITDEELLKEARAAIRGSEFQGKGRKLCLQGAAWAVGGALATGIVWLMTALL